MPFTRPTLTELINRAANDIEAKLPGTDARLRRSNLNVLARVHAAAVHGIYGYQQWLSRQILPDIAEDEFLDRIASLWLSEPRKAAAFAIGSAAFTGANGAVIPAGTVLSRADGVEYSTNAEAVIAAGVATAAITASAAGAAGNIETAGSTLTIVTAISGVNSAATAGVLSFGAEIETTEYLRARVLARMKYPPHGGSAADYATWALEVPGVTRAWCYPQELGPGTVTVRFVRDNDASLMPDALEVAAVQAYIDALKPVTAALTVVSPIAVPLNFSITASPGTADVHAAIATELEDLLRREAEPGGTILISHIREAISVAAGEVNYVMTTPAADITHTTGQMATMGVITWI